MFILEVIRSLTSPYQVVSMLSADDCSWS